MVEEKKTLMKKLGKKQPIIAFAAADIEHPSCLKRLGTGATNGGSEPSHSFTASQEHTAIPALLRRIGDLGIGYKDLNTRQSSLEDIFVSLVS